MITVNTYHVKGAVRWMMLAVISGYTFWGCVEKSAEDGPRNQGVIVYEVEYPELDPNGALVTMLPNELTLKFKDNKIKTIFKTVASIVEINIISDANTYEMANVVKIFGDRYVLKTDSTSDYRVGNPMGGVDVSPTEEQAQIANHTAQKLEVDFAEGAEHTFYVSDDIDIKDPNWCTIYEGISGMLMDYSIEQYEIVMHLRAKEVAYEEIADEEFQVSEDSKFLDQEEFEKVVIDNLKILMEDI